MATVFGCYLFACGKTSNMQLSQNSLSLQAIWLEINWSMTDPVYSVSRWLFFVVVVFDIHVIVIVLYWIACLHLCYIQNTPQVVLWQKVSFDTIFRVQEVGRQTRWWPRHKAIYFSWFGPELFCLLLGPPGFNCWFSFAPVFQWCCSAPRGSPGVGRNTFLSSPHLCFIIVFIDDLFVSCGDPLMS